MGLRFVSILYELYTVKSLVTCEREPIAILSRHLSRRTTYCSLYGFMITLRPPMALEVSGVATPAAGSCIVGFGLVFHSRQCDCERIVK